MLTSYNPSTGQQVGQVEITPVEMIDVVVARSKTAQSQWAEKALSDRLDALSAAGETLRQRAPEIATLLTKEMGKPLADAHSELRWITSAFDNEIEELREALKPEIITHDERKTTVFRDPFGIAVCISPWNFPLGMPHQQVLPALAAGNSVLLKPSEETPLTAQAYADCLLEHLPKDVLQVIHGNEQQGKALVAAEIDLVVFTGSKNAGVHILGEASKGLKRVILELGGKDPLVVLDGSDLKSAAKFAALNSFRNAGQVCVSTERIYVHDSVHDAFVDELVEVTKQMHVGDGLQDGIRIGPMISARQKAHVQEQVTQAVASGAQLHWSEGTDHGQFLGPMILTECSHDMAIAYDETFGPVACVYRVDDDAQAVQLANDTPYGLGAVVFGPAQRARDVARKMTAGMIGINQGLASAGSTPWVGARHSGYGFHSGIEGHRQFAQVRVMSESIV